MAIVFIDTETNGARMASLGQHRIIQLSYVLIDGQQTVVYDKFVDQSDVAPEITTLTGITRNDIWEYGISEHQAALDLKQLLQLHPVIVAHNCQFDLSMIFDLLQRQLGSVAYDLVSNCYWIDTLTIARDRWSYVYGQSGHKLSDCINHYNCNDVNNSHNALDDVQALISVFKAMMLERPDCNQYINVFGYNPKYQVHNKFGFITYKPQSNTRGFVNSDEILPEE